MLTAQKFSAAIVGSRTRRAFVACCAVLLAVLSSGTPRLRAQSDPIASVGLTAGWATFGQAVPQGLAREGLQVGSLVTQTDVKNRWPDGSIRFAIITTDVVVPGTYPIVAAGVFAGTFPPLLPPATVTLTIAGVPYTAALPATPSSDVWLSGPNVYEGRTVIAPVSSTDGTSHPFLRVNFDTRVYSDTTARVDVSVENLLNKAGATTVTYDVAIVVKGQSVFVKPGVQHFYLTRWRKVFQSGSTPVAAITPDITPFNQSRALPPYLSLVANQVNTVSGASYDILNVGALASNMPDHGGRPELAPFPDWTARYLVWKNPTQRAFVLANGDLSGSWPVHVREPEGSATAGVGTERLVSLDQRPTLWYDGRAQSSGLDFIRGTPLPIREYGSIIPGPGQTALIPDNAHQPSIAYVPYLLTGDRYYAEEMAFWANYSMLRTSNGDGVRGAKGILESNEVRGFGWALRNIADAAAYYPDASPVHSYLAQKVLNNLQWLDGYAAAQDPVTNPFKILWLGERPDGMQYTGMWEQNYLAYAIDRAGKQGFAGGLVHRDAIARFQLKLFTSDPGYPRAQGAPYVVGVGAPSGTVTWDGYKTFPFFTTMAQIWTATQGNERPFAGYYGPEARLNLMIGVEAGWAGAQASYDYLWPFIGTTSSFCATGANMPDLACRAGWALDFSAPSGPVIQQPAQLTSPAAGSTLVSSSQTFIWTAGTGVSSYTLGVGTMPGATDILAGTPMTSVSATVNGLPTNGATIWVRLSSNINGAWQSVDASFKAYAAPPAQATVPNVVGLTQSAATTAIGAAGLTLGSATTTASGTVALGSIISQSPAAGTRVAGNSAVNLVVSSGPSAPPPPGSRVTSLTEIGSFSLPADFAYGGRGLAYVAGSPEGLLISGFGRSPLTAKISIPASGTAAFLQALTDPTEGKGSTVNPGSTNDKMIGGYWPFGSQMLVSVFDSYDGSGTQAVSQFLRPLDLTIKGQVQGPCRAGPLGAGFYDGYAAAIPAEWQARLGGSVLIGNGGLNIIGRTSSGPAAFAIDPAQPCGSQSAKPLVYYPLAHATLGSYGTAGIHPVFNGTTRIDGAVFPVGTPSVLFFGRTGFGNYCYGLASECGNDTAEKYKGTHAQPYGYYIWAYDANDLASVAAGTKQPWDVTPYATWEPLPRDGGWDQILGAAYDPATGRIFVESQSSDNAVPKIHVFKVTSSGAASASVPNVVGLTQAAATSAITAASLTVGVVTTAASATVVVGSIISEGPAAGTSVAVQSAIALVVSSGAGSVNVPNVVGLTQSAGTSAIAAASLKVGLVTTAASATVAAGSIISENPAAGTSVAVQSAVALVVSSGGGGQTGTPLGVDVSVSLDRTGKLTTSSFSTSTPGEWLVAFGSSDGPSGGGQRLSISGANLVWTLVRRANTQAGTAEIWAAPASGQLVNVTVSSTQTVGGFHQSLTVVAFKGASGIGASASAAASQGGPTVSLTTTAAGSMVFGVGEDWTRAVARTLGPNQTMVHQWVDTSSGDTYWVERLDGAAAGAGTVVRLNATAPTNDFWNFASVEIRPKGTP